MPVISDTLDEAQRSQMGRIGDSPPAPTPEPTWKGEPCAPCTRCRAYFVASSLRTLHTPGASGLVCRTCKRVAIDELGY